MFVYVFSVLYSDKDYSIINQRNTNTKIVYS